MNAENKQKTVIVGMSGGVDSSVSALLLKQSGYNVIGMFMKNWEELDESGICQSAKEYADVIKVCEAIDIPYYSVEFVKEYRENVFKHFLEEYENGYTPNPDILCNREIKFKVFYEKALELGADYLATGHYCQAMTLKGKRRLVKGVDPGKEQTYFLYTMREEVLENVLFPIGHLLKSELREIAKNYNLPTMDKKDSTGICFIGERNFKNFLSQYIPSKAGQFENLAGEVVGEHSGSAYYTIGQRKGLGLGGPGEPWFVVAKDSERNIVIVERGDKHPALYADELWASELSWVDQKGPDTYPFRCKAKIRYRQKDQDCEINLLENGQLHIRFNSPQRAIALRQSIAFYMNLEGQEVCLGGGMIVKSGKTYFERNEIPKL